MVGGVAEARETAKSRPDLSDEIKAAVRHVLGEVGDEGGSRAQTIRSVQLRPIRSSSAPPRS
jgi:hypothetical protein